MTEPLQIVKYPDPILERETCPVETIDDALRERVQEMFALMYVSSGVGLAAPQVGWDARLFVINPSGGSDLSQEQTFINPQIVARSGRELGEEGCLSFPGLTVHVPRATRLCIRAQDLQGQTFEVEATDYVARILQHEHDHLLGILFITKATPADRITIDKKLKEMRAAAQPS